MGIPPRIPAALIDLFWGEPIAQRSPDPFPYVMVIILVAIALALVAP